MPVTPSALAKLRKSCSFEYLGETVNLEYYPAAMGADFAAKGKKLGMELQASAEADDATQQDALTRFGEWVCSFLASWDFMEDDGTTPQPITPKNIITLVETFSDFIICVVQAIGANYNQGNAKGTPSSANSRTTSSTTGASGSRAASPILSESASLPDGSMEPPPSNG
jgi:hypothetical protein